MKFTASVASFSMLLFDSQFKGSSDFDELLTWIQDSKLSDEHGFKEEFKELVAKAKQLK